MPLFDDIPSLSAPGSTVATEFVPGTVDFDTRRARENSAALREHGMDIDMSTLVYPGRRTPVMEYLQQQGWQVSTVPREELFVRYGRAVPEPDDDAALGDIVYVNATR